MKLITKIVGATLGLALAVGVGVGVANNNKTAKEANAASGVVWTRITSVNNLTSGTYIMGYEATAGSGTIVPLRSDGSTATTSANGILWTGTTQGSSTNGTLTMSSLGDGGANYEVTVTVVSDGVINIQNAAGKYYGASSGGNSKNTARLYNSGNSNETNFTLNYSSNKFGLTAGVSGSYKYLKYNTGDPRYACYNSSANDTSFYKKTIVSLSSIALSGTYPTAFTLGDEFSHDGMVVTATYSDSTTANVTASASFSGYNMEAIGNQTVTVSYTEAGVTKTATYGITVNSAGAPVITLDRESISGYTGEEFSVTATFANLTSDFAWGSPTGSGSLSNTSTDATGTATDGTSTLSGKLSGAGTVTLSTSGGGVSSAPSVTFTITQTAISLNKNATSIAQGASETLVATTNVGGVTWSSNNAKVSVSNGVITVASDAVAGSTATITATSDVDSNVSASCVVTVVYPEKVVEITAANLLGYNTENIAYTSETNNATINGLNIEYFGCGAYGSGIQMRTNDSTGTSTIYNKTKAPLKKLEFVWNSSKTVSNNPYHLFVEFSNESDFSVLVGEKQNVTFNSSTKLAEATPTASAKYFRITHANQGNTLYVDTIRVLYENPKSNLEEVVPVSTAVENQEALRFGARILKTAWSTLDNGWGISDYGVMLFRQKDDPASYSETPVQDAYNAKKTLTVGHKGSGEAPNTEGDYYEFTVKVNITKEENKSIIFCAAPFIVIAGQYYFLCEVQGSYNSLTA